MGRTTIKRERHGAEGRRRRRSRRTGGLVAAIAAAALISTTLVAAPAFADAAPAGPVSSPMPSAGDVSPSDQATPTPTKAPPRVATSTRSPAATPSPAASSTPTPAATPSPASSPTPTPDATGSADRLALVRAFASASHLPIADVAGIRDGSLRIGITSGARWATATFSPASTEPQVAAAFQSGAASAVFTESNGTWTLVHIGIYGCGRGLPSALASTWGLGTAAVCSAAAGGGAAPATGSAPGEGTGIGAKVAAIARQQVGNGDNPIATSFSGLNCNPYTTMVAGFSANSNGCGYDTTFSVRNSNENWCADFAKWVWHRAGVTADMNTINAAASSFYQWGLDQGQSPKADAGTPAVGDAIAFFGPGAVSTTAYADHVGLVVGVNSDGTIDMVNGDFLAATNVHVELDANLTLSTFAPRTWGAGEQWVIITPPTAPQKPNPVAHLSAPSTAVVATESTFQVRATESGGSVAAYYWTFGDGRTSNATGADVTHVFASPGIHTVTVTATSNVGTIVTERQDVSVLAGSNTVAVVPSTAVWYSSYPASYYRFIRSPSGLAADVWDGASWLEIPTAGSPAATGAIATVAYPDSAENSATTPHAYFRAVDGSLAQTFLHGGSWTTQTLPGTPGKGSDIVAAVTSSGPAVFFVDAHGKLSETSQRSGTWSTRTLTSTTVRPTPLAVTESAMGPRIFAVGRAGRLTATMPIGQYWWTEPLWVKTHRQVSLAATTTPAGQARIIVNGVADRGKGTTLVALTEQFWAWWTPGVVARGAAESGSVAASTYLVAEKTEPLGTFVQPPGSLTPSGPAHPLGSAVAYLATDGSPKVASDAGSGWTTEALPSTAATVAGISAVPVANQPFQVYLTTASGRVMDTTAAGAAPSGAAWTSQPLPSTPADFHGRILLYAATSADRAAAEAAATAAGLPSSQVTTSFEVAWAAVLSGNYLVITSGLAATDALEYNACGWVNPSAEIPGHTPFDYLTAARTSLPGLGLFLNGAGTTAALAQQRLTDLAYYAVNGTLPPGGGSIPAHARSQRICSGSPS